MLEESIKCSLCASEKTDFFFEDKFRPYNRCRNCSLIFVTPEFHVSREREKSRYEEHNNDPDDRGYRDFLERITLPIKDKFDPPARGLDFGCGPTTLLADILSEKGFEMDVYDLFYQPDTSVLEKKFDFIVTTEVVEHLAKPLDVFEMLLSMLKPNGMLAVMTRLHDDSIDFKTWHYKNDPTHICFFSVETFEWLSARLGVEHRRVESDIYVFAQLVE
ncbi:MAG: class I SAM-dependent methyltransferase [Pyrinomonadaceae bacterium]|nr:class I SAM-dependent methyltransferase [Pyrinomonadaceae bacterium]